MSKTKLKSQTKQRNFGYEDHNDSKHIKRMRSAMSQSKNWQKLDRALKTGDWRHATRYSEE
jgi:transposase-like protein